MTKQLTIKTFPPILAITDSPSLAKASTLRSEIKAELKRLKADKDPILNKAKAVVEDIKARYKPREDALNTLLEDIDAEMIKYQTSITNTQQQAQDKFADRVARGTLKPETAVSKMEALDAVDKSVGNTTFIATACFEVMSITDLPLDYHLPNEVLIRSQMKAGIHLPGVRYYTEQRPRNTK